MASKASLSRKKTTVHWAILFTFLAYKNSGNSLQVFLEVLLEWDKISLGKKCKKYLQRLLRHSERYFRTIFASFFFFLFKFVCPNKSVFTQKAVQNEFWVYYLKLFSCKANSALDSTKFISNSLWKVSHSDSNSNRKYYTE